MDPTLPQADPYGGIAGPQQSALGNQQTAMTPQQLQQMLMLQNLMGQSQMPTGPQGGAAGAGPGGGISPQAYGSMFGMPPNPYGAF